MCRECSHGWTTLGLPQPKTACPSCVHTTQAPGCSARALSRVGPAFCAHPRSELLRFLGAPQRHRPRWAVCFVRMTGARRAHGLRRAVHLTHLPGPGSSVSWLCCKSRVQVCSVSPLGADQAVTLLADVSHPGSQEDVVSNWDPAHSLVEDVDSGAKIETAPCLLALAVACLPLCVWRRRALYGSWLALLWYSAFGILFWYSRSPVLGEHTRGSPMQC